MKSRKIPLAVIAVLFLCGIACSAVREMRSYPFYETKDGRIISREDGTEYTFLAFESDLVLLGEYEHAGQLQGEDKYLRHMGFNTLSGIYLPENSDKSSVLERILPNCEWYQIYRDASLPALDTSLDGIVRIEWIGGSLARYYADISHSSCGYGLTGEKMREFFKAVYASPTADEANLAESIRKDNGLLENCYVAAYVFGYFEDEPNIALTMEILSYNDTAYTISLPYEDYYEEYIIPDEWLTELLKEAHILTTAGGNISIISMGGFDNQEE